MARSRRIAPLGLAFGAAVALSALVACNALIGLDEFDKGQCPGARCDAGSEPDVVVPADAGPDAIADGGKGADPVSWARWPMPNYDAGADSGLVNPLSYTTNADGVFDNVTKLQWRADVVAGGAVTYDAAVAACASVGPGSWRLPKRIELVTLLDFGQTRGVYADPVFDFANVTVWTSSEQRPFVGGPDQKYWTVHFESGVVDVLPRGLQASVLCVKAK